MGAHFVADLILFCYERHFICSLFDNNQSDVVKVFSSTSRYLDYLLNIDTPYFEQTVSQIPTPLNYAQSDQNLCKSLEYSMNVQLLVEQHLKFISLKGACKGWSESTFVKRPHCLKSHVTAHKHV